jgi:anti-anti-sigma factor
MTSTMTPAVGGFAVESTFLADHALLRLRGDLDVSTSGQLGEIARRVSSEGIPRLVLDLSQLEFIDASGLAELAAALKRQRELGGEVVLQSPTPHALRVFAMVGFTRVFTIR